MISPDGSTDSILKRQNSVEWWYFAPIVLAIFMFLLMGTLFESRIEALYRSIVERRQANLSQQSEVQQEVTVPATSTSLQTVASQKSVSIKLTAEKSSSEPKIQAGKETITS